MAQKKKLNLEVTTMPCPVPGHKGMAEVVHTDSRDYAVCHCPGRHKHYGQVVWEHIPTKKGV